MHPPSQKPVPLYLFNYSKAMYDRTQAHSSMLDSIECFVTLCHFQLFSSSECNPPFVFKYCWLLLKFILVICPINLIWWYDLVFFFSEVLLHKACLDLRCKSTFEAKIILSKDQNPYSCFHFTFIRWICIRMRAIVFSTTNQTYL